MIDYYLLAATIAIIIVLLLYLFFWNKLIGYVIGTAFRVAYWNKGGESTWVHIGSIHFALLAGRILFKDVRYHSASQTIKIVKGQVSWRYWIRAPTLEEDLQARATGEDVDARRGLRPSSCRIHASVEGFEWFLYNRTTAFDNIVSQMQEKEPASEGRGHGTEHPATSLRNIFSKSSAAVETDPQYPPPSQSRIIPVKTPDFLRAFIERLRKQLPNLDPKSLLPVSFEGVKGAIVCGNMSTPSVLVAEFSRAEGIFGTVPSKCSLDLYKQLLNIKFQNASISMNENEQYADSMSSTGERLREQIRLAHSFSLRSFQYLAYSAFAKLWRPAKLARAMNSLRDAAKANRQPTTTLASSFRNRRKRARSIDQETPPGADFSLLEYAIDRKILEAPVLELSYYLDAVGVVPTEEQADGVHSCSFGNGGTPPEWGLDLVVHGGFFRYGPWADRQRAELQRAFFPPAYQDLKPSPRVSPGDNRIWTAMRVFVELRGGTTLQIPFREASKNWMWDGIVKLTRPRKREGASLSVKAGDDSTISYLMPMVADRSGYHPLVEVHLDTVTVSSSLNDIRLLTAESCRVQGNLHSPLKWNEHREWGFNISLRQPVLYLLRDHINMLTDLGKDWSTGPPSNYYTWVPMRYVVDLDFRNYEINTYVNDHNIIDKPLIRDENALLTIRGPLLRNKNVIPSDKYRPMSTTVPFFLEVPNVTISLTLPKWSTHRLQALEPITKVATIGSLRLDGSYLYFADVREANVEQLRLNFTADDVIFKCLAWSIRHFMILRDNYFGSFTHFSTLREYLEKRRTGSVGDPIELSYRRGHSNVLQVELQLTINRGLIILPAGLPGYETYLPLPGQPPEDVDLGGCAVLALPELDVQLRTHDYGMEMSLNVGTLYGSAMTKSTERSLFEHPEWIPSGEVLLLERIDIVANRLFGPQPQTATYVCIWEISIGDIKSAVSSAELRTLMTAFDVFMLNYRDPLNSPAVEYAVPADPDVTFLKITIGSIDLTWSAAPVAVQTRMPGGLRMEMNDMAGNNHRKVTSIQLPEVIVKVLSTHPSRGHWIEVAEVVFDLAVDIYSCPPGWQDSAIAQAAFLAVQDAPTRRLAAVINHAQTGRKRPHGGSGLYMPVLRLPRPLRRRQPSFSEVKVELGPDTQLNGDLTKPMPFSHRHPYNSDSEGDTYAETDRDLRLAKSRPTSMNPEFRVDSESMSSGDESDNADLTDDTGTDSDWSDDESRASKQPLSNPYSKFSRHYIFHASRRPSSWAGSPMILARDRRPIVDPPINHRKGPLDTEGRGAFSQWHAEPCDDEHDSTTVRVQNRSVSVWLTPVLPSAMVQVLEEHSKASIGSEQRIDILLSNRIKTLVATSDTIRDLIFSVQLSSLHIRAVQLVASVSPQGGPGVLQDGEATCSADEVTTIDLRLHDFSFRGQTTQRNKRPANSFAASIGRLCLALSTYGSASKNGRLQGSHTVMDVALTRPEFSLTPKRVDVSNGSLEMSLEHVAVEYALSVVSAYMGPTLQALQDRRRLREHELSVARVRIHQILVWSQEHSVVDPLSTIQPSYLIQTGRPHDLRTNAGNKVLVYLRSCLRFLEPEQHQAVRELQLGDRPEVSRETIIELLESQLTGLVTEGDFSTLVDTDLLSELYAAPDQKHATVEKLYDTSIEAINISSQNIKLSILDPSHATASDVTIGPISVVAGLRKSELLPPVPTKHAKDITSHRDKVRPKFEHLMLAITLDSIEVFILPHLLYFAERILLLRRRVGGLPTSTPDHTSRPSSRILPAMDAVYCDLTVSLNHLRLQAAAEKLVLVLDISRLAFVSSLYLRLFANPQGRFDMSANSSLIVDAMSLEARSSANRSAPSSQDALAVITIRNAKANGVVRQELALSSTVRAVLVMDDLRLSVPRSAIRLSRFIEEWRADFLPGIEKTLQTLLTEVRPEPKARSSPAPAQPRLPTIHLQLSLVSFGIFLHVMPGTWLSWESFNIVTYLRLGLTNSRKLSPSFGLRLSSQRISIMSMSSDGIDASPTERLKLDLPSLTVTGRYENHGVHALASVGLFRAIVKPSYWDTLLSVQQKFGQDFNDLLHFLADARRKRPVKAKQQDVGPSKFTLHGGLVKVKGFRIGLEGHSSTVFLECQDINGGYKIEDGKIWHLNVTGLALSLAPRAYASARTAVFNGNHRSAFVIIDFKAKVRHRSNGEKDVQVVVQKTHAVLQPSSIGEIGDFIDHLQAEVLIRQEERARELAAFKEKTRNVMKTFEVKSKETNADAHFSALSGYATTLTIKNIGAAFPLSLDGNLTLPQGVHQHPAVPAFLFSIKSLVFGAERSGTGQFTMQGFSFQFVNRFKQSTPSDFSGENHQTRNRLIYPEMTAQLRSERSLTSRRIRVGANVSGFILDLDSSIPDHVFSLIDVYRRGKERVDRLTANLPRSAMAQDLKPKLEAIAAEKQDKALPTSSILLSLVFLSGQVRMHSGAALPRSSSLHDIKDARMPVSVAESFNLPVVSVWGEYRATPTSKKLSGSQDAEPSSLMFKSTVHSSENTLRPSLLPFLAELVNHVEVRMRKISWQSSDTTTSSARELMSSVPAELYSAGGTGPASSLQITFALRIDSSKLQLTCQPDVNVIAGIHWDSGGFVVNIASGARQVSFLGNVGGLTIGLKHGFLSEDCVRLDARNLNFSASFAKGDDALKGTTSIVSIVVDTEISGGVRFSRLQDVLCFKAVWLDRIPVFSGHSSATPIKPPVTTSPSPGGTTAKQDLTTAILVRVRRIGLNVDLGQSISSVSLDMDNVVLRSKLEQTCSELSLSIADVRILATGNVSGHGHIPDFSFKTVQRKDFASQTEDILAHPRMLDMSLTSGTLDLTLESDYQKILHLWAEPLSIAVVDDWAQMSPQIPVLERLLRLSFIVVGTEVLAIATVGTMPKLVSYATKFKANLEAQREGAARESKAFRIAQTPKPDNPLSAFANAMLQSARTRLKEKEDGFSFVVQQQMNFSLRFLRLVVFPRTMTDVEMAHFVARDLRANLDRIVESDTLPAKRKLQLAFSSMSTSRFSQLNHATVKADDVLSDSRPWFEAIRKGAAESTIFELPAMDMFMESEEVDDGQTKTINYSFVSKFAREDGAKEHPVKDQDDIYITLNVSLYSWLTLLRKNLAREMDQVQGPGDWRQSMPPASGASSPRKKSIVEPQAPDLSGRDGVVSPTLRPRVTTVSNDTRSSPPSSSQIHKKTGSLSSGVVRALAPPIEFKTSPPAAAPPATTSGIVYVPLHRRIERLNMRQLGEATPDVMHPFFMKKAGFSLEDSLPQYVHEYATMPIEEITQALLRLYSKQLSSSGQI
ncbi:hypothetical protein BV25DRAFT_1994498 [Artomyces pyxidatus]|uniref:Uncharacterized protein n=1 Tax=Artomyces pyxidatus TaxID=48021 RepID=A0ACB8SPD0_9AGAM|nr:hypothetical protein BV25DRAFT_1994498 [Artomyces pyxidatus]